MHFLIVPGMDHVAGVNGRDDEAKTRKGYLRRFFQNDKNEERVKIAVLGWQTVRPAVMISGTQKDQDPNFDATPILVKFASGRLHGTTEAAARRYLKRLPSDPQIGTPGTTVCGDAVARILLTMLHVAERSSRYSDAYPGRLCLCSKTYNPFEYADEARDLAECKDRQYLDSFTIFMRHQIKRNGIEDPDTQEQLDAFAHMARPDNLQCERNLRDVTRCILLVLADPF
ncbi:unnamed protein product, partial [Amoebophrya sp. A25]|eukprot:GSA25T00021491001.1